MIYTTDQKSKTSNIFKKKQLKMFFSKDALFKSDSKYIIMLQIFF